MTVELREDDPARPEVMALLMAHLAHSVRHSSPDSIHALDHNGLRAPDVTFWTAWEGAALVGFGALKQLDTEHGEIKSMHTNEAYRRRGIAAAVLAGIIAEGRRRGYRRLSLETGSMAAYAPARALYARFGFTPCRPFADYCEDPKSAFMTLDLAG